jgi:hypothetical protein
MTKKSSKKAKSQRSRERALLKKVHLNAAGIDVGADTHWVAVPEDRDERPVRKFGVFTSDLIGLCEWLKVCQIQTVAMDRPEFIGFLFFKCWRGTALRCGLLQTCQACRNPRQSDPCLNL